DEQRHDVLQVVRVAIVFAYKLVDVQLRTQAFEARSVAAVAAGEFEEAITWTQRQLELAQQITDADHVADAYELAIPACCVMGRIKEARRLAQKHNDLVRPLTPHHRLHGVR